MIIGALLLANVAPPVYAVAPPAPPPPTVLPTRARRPHLLLQGDEPLVSEDDYPLAALRRQASGVTVVEVAVSEKGRVTECGIAAGSGDDALDTAACQLLLQRARYSPALDERGAKVPGTLRQRVRWALPPFDDDVYRLSLTRAADGVLTQCAIVAPNLRIAYDLAECRRLDTLDGMPPLTDGLPIDWAAPLDWPWPKLPD